MEDWDQEMLEKAIARAWPACRAACRAAAPLPARRRPALPVGALRPPGRAGPHPPAAHTRRARVAPAAVVQRSTRATTATTPPRSFASSSGGCGEGGWVGGGLGGGAVAVLLEGRADSTAGAARLHLASLPLPPSLPSPRPPAALPAAPVRDWWFWHGEGGGVWGEGRERGVPASAPPHPCPACASRAALHTLHSASPAAPLLFDQVWVVLAGARAAAGSAGRGWAGLWAQGGHARAPPPPASARRRLPPLPGLHPPRPRLMGCQPPPNPLLVCVCSAPNGKGLQVPPRAAARLCAQEPDERAAGGRGGQREWWRRRQGARCRRPPASRLPCRRRTRPRTSCHALPQPLALPAPAPPHAARAVPCTCRRRCLWRRRLRRSGARWRPKTPITVEVRPPRPAACLPFCFRGF